VLLTGLVALTIPVGRLAAAWGVPEPGPGRLAADFASFAGAYALSGLVAPDAPGALAVTSIAVWVVRIGAPLALDVARRVDASGLESAPVGKRRAAA
jgi:hypothetical protein